MDVSDKKTALEDSASIYHPHEERTDKETWKELKGFRAKWAHFRSYYLMKVVFSLAAIALLVYVIYTFVKPKKECQLFVAILDEVMLGVDVEDLQEEYETYFKLDKATQEMIFKADMNISSKGDTVSAQRFSAYLFAREMDVVIATESCFKNIAEGCAFPLSEQLPEDLYIELKDRFCYAAQRDDYGEEVAGSEQPYGVYVTDLLKVNPYCNEELVLLFCGNSEHKENAEAFLRFLLQKENSKTEE